MRMGADRSISCGVEAAGGRPGFPSDGGFGAICANLDQAVAGGLVEVVPARALAARRDANGWRIEIEGRGEVTADALALAQGNQPPEPLRGTEQLGGRFVNNPWVAESAAAIARVADSGGDALIVGTGLTMVDMVLSLDAAGHRGRIVAVAAGQFSGHTRVWRGEGRARGVPGNCQRVWPWLRRRGGEEAAARGGPTAGGPIRIRSGIMNGTKRGGSSGMRVPGGKCTARIAPQVAARSEEGRRGAVEIVEADRASERLKPG